MISLNFLEDLFKGFALYWVHKEQPDSIKKAAGAAAQNG